jgi:Flp pilus assembly protein TadD
MRNLAIVIAHQGHDVEGLALMDSAIARDQSQGNVDAVAYLRGQQVPMLIRLGRSTDALRHAEIGAESRARRPRGSTYVADLTYWLGLATLANGRVDEAVKQLGVAHEDIDDNFPAEHPRKAMVRCALGVALARAGRDDEARGHLADACPRLDDWGLADPTVVTWGRRESVRLGIVRPE